MLLKRRDLSALSTIGRLLQPVAHWFRRATTLEDAYAASFHPWLGLVAWAPVADPAGWGPHADPAGGFGVLTAQ